MKPAIVICMALLTFYQPLVTSKNPHILFIVADDLGWNDVGFRNSEIHSPTLDKMAEAGIILNSSYVQPVCSPSRASFMSSYFPFRLGLQHKTIIASQKAYLPADVITLPQRLRELGYATHIVGKWHLGFCNWNYTPTFRGFDSFYGFYNAREDYYNHTGSRDAYDFRSNTSVEVAAKGHYSADLFSAKVVEIIKSHDPSRPLFIYLPFQSVHDPLQVPEEYVQRYCSKVVKESRRLYCGMVAALDEAVTNVTSTMQEAGLWEDTIVFFTTDNGGPIPEGADNWPLRGSKGTLWEGGTRGTAFIYSQSWLNKTGYTYNGLFHAVDWYPTILSAAAGSKANHLLEKTDIDGISQWQALLQNGPSPRDEFVYNIDEIDQNGALRLGRYKLIEGRPGTIGQDVEETDDLNIYDEAWDRAVDSSDMSPLLSCHLSD
ncbi:arylsulfatase B-like isoform X2 [Pomacea canaliculata]|uniref:arylsulfatase B-like isoform X2 n=1 Tax=Pomacea canaliculata TaxID=400727 RepID=UPI000D736C48|nr:arylsulfatase B-like isoform X2 [Pomacea canaliculata]